jgi:hypothetical protein
MKKKYFSYMLLSCIALFSLNLSTNAQNVIITDDDSFSAHSSAMLHIESLNKGLLIPRLTEAQRDAILSPAEGLLIYQTNNNPGIYIYESGWRLFGGDLGFHTATQNLMLNNNWLSNDGDDEGIIITDDGKVGIDTTSPQVKLHVVSEDNDIAIFESRSSHGIIHIKSKDSSKVAALYGSLGNDAVGALDFRPLTGDLTLWTNDLGGSSWHQRMMIKNSSGYVGIGTDTPTSQLTIQTSGSGYNGFSGLHIKELTDRGTLTLESVTNDPTDFVMKNNNRYSWSISSRNSSDNYALKFYAAPDGTSFSTMAMSLTTDGKLGLGITNPIYTIDANGEITSREKTGFRIRQPSYGTLFRNDNVNFYMLLTNPGDPDGIWNDLRPFRIYLEEGHVSLGNHALFVQHGGNVGIGTTNPTNKLDIAGGNLDLNDNALYIRDSDGSKYGMGFSLEGGEQLTIFSDAIIDFTESDSDVNVMRIDANNRKVGIGTTTPTAKLSIRADANTGDTLFAVKDKDGNNVFVVYPDAVQVIVPTDTKDGDRHKRGAFVVSGRGTSKATTNFVDLTKENYLIGHNVAPNIYGTKNSVYGYEAGRVITGGYDNVFIGNQAGYSATKGSRNVFIGNNAGYKTTGYSINSGSYNIFLGHNAGYDNQTGLANICIGGHSGEHNTGSNNIFIGVAAGNDNTGSNNIIIGNQADIVGSNKLIIGNNYYPLIYGDFSTEILAFMGLKVGVGTETPAEDFHVRRSDLDVARIYATGISQGSGMFYAGQSPTYGGGFVYDGDGTPTLVGPTDYITHFRRDNSSDYQVFYYKYNSNNVTFQGNITQLSDKKYKKNIQKIGNVIDKLKNIDAVYYNWKNEEFPEQGFSEKREIGFIAQNLEDSFPELVLENEEGVKSINYIKMTTILTEAVKEQQQQIENKDAEIKELRRRLEIIEEYISKQKK